jgi:hypothetical protein
VLAAVYVLFAVTCETTRVIFIITHKYAKYVIAL